MRSGEIDIQVHDYFTPQETVADVYWLRGVVYVHIFLSETELVWIVTDV